MKNEPKFSELISQELINFLNQLRTNLESRLNEMNSNKLNTKILSSLLDEVNTQLEEFVSGLNLYPVRKYLNAEHRNHIEKIESSIGIDTDKNYSDKEVDFVAHLAEFKLEPGSPVFEFIEYLGTIYPWFEAQMQLSFALEEFKNSKPNTVTSAFVEAYIAYPKESSPEYIQGYQAYLKKLADILKIEITFEG